MKVILTAIVEITGKDGREWTKLCFVKSNGETGDKLIPRDKFDLTGVETVNLEGQENVDLTFNDRGQLEQIS